MMPCLYCGQNTWEPWRRNCRDYFMGFPLVVSYSRCDACGSAQQDEIPENVDSLYADYPIHRHRSKLFNQLRALLFKDIYFNATGLPAETRILDYGCGDGWYLESLRASKPHLCGYEFSAAHATALQSTLGIRVTSDFTDLSGFEPQGFDVITLHFVFEHVTDPAPLLARLAGLLRSGGRIYIVIPEASSWEAKCFGVYWHGLDPPRHISFASKQGIETAAVKTGLTLLQSKKLAFPNTLAGSLATLPLRKFKPPLFNLMLPLGMMASYLFPGGSVAYTLTRP